MNVLWLSHNVPYPPIGGVLQRSYNLLQQLGSRHRVYLVALNQRAILPAEKDIEEARVALESVCAHVDIVPIPSDASRHAWYRLVISSFITRTAYNVNWLRSTVMHRKIAAIMERVRFDVIHYDTIGLMEYFGHARGCATILNHHNIESAMLVRRAEMEANPLKKIYFRREGSVLESLERLYGPQVDVNLTVSRLDAVRLQAISPAAAIEVCENGTDPGYFQPDVMSRAEPGHLLFVGGMRWYPNRDAMLYFCREVWPRCVAQMPSLELTIAGAHPPAELRQMAGADNRIRVQGYVDDVRPYFDRADIFICPIRDGGGTRLKVLDAMAMGKAIVSTSIGCEGLDVVHGEHVLIADTPEDFATCVGRLLSQPALKADLGARARKLVHEKYSWDVIGRRLMAVYERLGARHEPSRAVAAR